MDTHVTCVLTLTFDGGTGASSGPSSLSARCMRTLLRVRMGPTPCLMHWTGVPVFRGPSACAASGAPCMLFDDLSVHDERHLLFECPAMQCVRQDTALFISCCYAAVHVGVEQYIVVCF